MPNVFTNVPVPTSNSVGASTDISNLGWFKQLIVTGPFSATINVEISNDGATWAPLATFSAPGNIALPFATAFVRAAVSAYESGTPLLYVGSDDLGVTVVTPIPVAAGNGTGAPASTSSSGQLKTFIYGGGVGVMGTLNVEVSADGVNFSQVATFSGPTPGYTNVGFSAFSVRTSRTGAGGATPTMSMAAAVPASDTSTAPSTSFVFRPGGVANGNVYTDWATLAAAIAGVAGARNLQFDDSIVSPCVIPSGTWDMTDVEWNGHIIRPTQVEIGEGVLLPGLRAFNHSLRINFTGTTPPISDFAPPPGGNENVIFERGCEITCTGTGPFIRNNQIAGPVNLVLFLASRLVTGATPCVDIVAGAQIVIILCEICDLQPNTISGAVGSSLLYGIGASGQLGLSLVQPAFLGSASIFNVTVARYNPSSLITGNAGASGNDVVRCDPSGGGFDIALPAASATYGQTIIIKNTTASANVITITPNGADTIDGGPGANIAAGFGVVRLVSDGVSDWMVC